MLELDDSYLGFKTKSLYFPDEIFDVDGYDNVTFCHYDRDVKTSKYEKVGALTGLISLDQDLDKLWSSFKPKTRQKIRKAEKLGVEVKVNADYDRFFELHHKFNVRKGLAIPFKRSIPPFNFIRDHGCILTSYHDDQMLGGLVSLVEGDSTYILRLASSRLEAEDEMRSVYSCQNFFLIWETIQHLKSIGVDNWDWGGLWTSDYVNLDPEKAGNNQFKLSFGAKEKHTWNFVKNSKKFDLCKTLAQYFV